MFELTNKHLELITADVNKADISYSHLRYDLIDHICCDLENEMSHGLSFEKAYEVVKARIGIHGLQRIQEDTLLLIDKKYRIMKNTMKIFGVISTILMAFGALFKIEHWPGAGILLVVGFFLLTFVFLPSAVYVSYREVSNRTKLFTHLTGFLAGFLFAISFLFKIQHWPGTGILMLVATIITSLGFIPAFFINQFKEADSKAQKTAFVFGLLGAVAYLFGFYFKMNHWPGASILLLSGSFFLLVLAFPVFILSHYKSYENVSSRFIFMVFAVVWFIVPTFLMSMNVSEDTYKGIRESETLAENHIEYLTAKNAKLLTKIAATTSPELLKNKEIATAIKQQSDELMNDIQNVKSKLIQYVSGDSSVVNQQITIEKIAHMDLGNRNAGEFVLFRDGVAQKIQDKLEKYTMFIIQQAGKEDNINVMLSELLSISTLNSTSHRSLSVITSIHQLSSIQEKVRMAESLCLQGLAAKATKEPLLAKGQ